MTTLTLEIDQNSGNVSKLMEDIEKFVAKRKGLALRHEPNAETIRAIKDVEAGRVIKTKNKKDFFTKLNS